MQLKLDERKLLITPVDLRTPLFADESRVSADAAIAITLAERLGFKVEYWFAGSNFPELSETSVFEDVIEQRARERCGLCSDRQYHLASQPVD
jgi:hypothetical protein